MYWQHFVSAYVQYRKLDYISRNWNKVMPAALDFNDTVDDCLKIEVVEKVKEFYYNDLAVADNNYDILIKV